MTVLPSPSPSQRGAGDAFSRLLQIMEALRTPETGCPWDLEQDFASIAPYTIEEAYEVADAIAEGDLDALCKELGDLLFQVAFHSQMASEAGAFTAEDVANSVAEKMLERHPHVFVDPDGRSSVGQAEAWEDMKAAERAASGTSQSALDGVALALPALMRAEKLQRRAARTGFDWATPEPVFEKLDEELEEVKTALAEGNQDALEDEVGDLLFVCVNLARRLSVDPEAALRRANAKFARRFRAMESLASQAVPPFDQRSLEAQEALWTMVKEQENTASRPK